MRVVRRAVSSTVCMPKYVEFHRAAALSANTDLDDYWTQQYSVPETPSEPHLSVETIECVEPLDAQFGVADAKTVPDVLYEPLFGQPEPTEGELEQTGRDPGQVPPLHTYAILDAATVAGLAELLAASGLEHRCLFKGDAYDELKDVAPWVVRLEDANNLTRNLFTRSDAGWHLWENEPGIYLRSHGTLDEMWGHFRKFTKVKDEQGKWFYFRFWQPSILYGLAEHVTLLASHICAPLQSVLAPLDTHTVGHVLNHHPTIERPEPLVISMQTKSVLSKIRQRRMLVEIAENLFLADPAATTSLDWPGQRDQTVSWGNHALQTYGLRKHKSLHSYLMIRHAMPEAFDDKASQINEILMAPSSESAKMNTLISYLRTI